jgi:uncharacterized membrane protein
MRLRIIVSQVRALPGVSLVLNDLRAVIVHASLISYALFGLWMRKRTGKSESKNATYYKTGIPSPTFALSLCTSA